MRKIIHSLSIFSIIGAFAFDSPRNVETYTFIYFLFDMVKNKGATKGILLKSIIHPFRLGTWYVNDDNIWGSPLQGLVSSDTQMGLVHFHYNIIKHVNFLTV